MTSLDSRKKNLKLKKDFCWFDFFFRLKKFGVQVFFQNGDFLKKVFRKNRVESRARMETELQLYKRWVQSRDARRAFHVHAGLTGRVSQFQAWITTEESTPAFLAWKKSNVDTKK